MTIFSFQCIIELDGICKGGNDMSKLMRIDKKIEESAKNWFVRKQKKQNQALAKTWFEENKEQVIEEYLEKHPKTKEEYQNKKKTLVRVKLLIGGAGLIATTLGAGSYVAKHYQKEDNTRIQQEVEQETQIEVEENTYEEFFEEAKKIENTKKREEFITNQTKQNIVEAYNQEHEENPITAERLETLILNEFVLQKKDRIGNYTYERVPQNVQYEQTEAQKLVKIGVLYDFRVDGKTVAVFNRNGEVIQDKNIEKQDMSFQKMVSMVKQSEKLKEIYRYPSNEQEKREAEQTYQEISNNLTEKSEPENKEKIID